MRYVKIFFLLFFLTLMLVFVFENVQALSAPVNLRYDFLFLSLGPFAIPLYALLFAALFAGALPLALADFFLLFRQRRQMKKKDKRIAELESELEKFRNLPLTETTEIEPAAPAEKPAEPQPES
ncbi:MAG: LapA family protein [Deltaproteobacteria bacterium]|nr:LapA family protein [Deltaproteobacteria bacterium]